MNYFNIIHKYIPPDSPVYPIYVTHCHMVAQKALRIGRARKLSDKSLRFIEEAAMLHDIGIIRTHAPSMHCAGRLNYICHGPEGRQILEGEGLPRHALVADRHTGVGLTVEDIVRQKIPVAHRDMTPQSIEEQIICYADLFYSKGKGDLWIEKSIKRVRKNVGKRGKHKLAILDGWIKEFGEERD